MDFELEEMKLELETQQNNIKRTELRKLKIMADAEYQCKQQDSVVARLQAKIEELSTKIEEAEQKQ